MKKIIVIALVALASSLGSTASFAQDDDHLPESWKLLSSVRDDYAIWCMHFKDEQNGWAAGPGIIIHSTDGGKTWEKQKTGFGGRPLAIYFKNAKDGYAAGESNFYMDTHDGGATWTDRSSMFQSAKFIKIFFVSDQAGYMLSETGVYRTTDGGKTWKDLGPKKPSEYSTEDFTGLAASDAKHLVLVGNKEMMYTSDDGGTTWVANKKDYFSGPRRRLHSVSFTDAKNGFIACALSQGPDVDCLVTTDGGVTWTPKNVFGNREINIINFNGKTGWGTMWDNPHGLIVTHDGGATWNMQMVAKDYKVKCSSFVSPKASFVGLHGKDGLFSVYVPSTN